MQDQDKSKNTFSSAGVQQNLHRNRRLSQTLSQPESKPVKQAKPLTNAKGSAEILAEEVDSLLNMPQSLCKQRGCCCAAATFKGSLSYDEIKAIAQDPNNLDQVNANDFVSVFEPYASQAETAEIFPEFVERIRDFAQGKGEDPDKITFFKCRYLLENNLCGIHEDRPTGCRTYPMAHKNTIFHPGCGFEEQSRQNWARIKAILDKLGLDDNAKPKS